MVNKNMNEQEYQYICTSCGEDVRAEDKVCPKCGEDLGEEIYEYICTACNEVVGVKETVCPTCGEHMGEEFDKKELEHIVRKGPDKAHTFLITYFESKEKEKTIALSKMIVKAYPDSKQAKWAAEILERANKLRPKKAKYEKRTQQYCPNCKRITEISKPICECGYNFTEPNLEEISLVKQKRTTSNRIIGIMMILVGTIFLIFHWPSDVSARNTSMDKFIYGIPALLVLFGLYKLFFGRTLKNPTKTPFDSLLGDTEDTKDKHDDIPYTFCSSCGKQLLKELNYKHCPYCKTKLK